MAEDVVDKVVKLLGKRKSCSTKKVPFYGWDRISRNHWNKWANSAKKHMKSHFGLEEDIAEHLLRYGIHYTCICELFDPDTDLIA